MDLLQIIEELRQQLEEIGIEKGLQDPEVLEASQRLDRLINEYYRFSRNELCFAKVS